MKFRIQDREYEFDGEYTLDEGLLFFDKAGLGIAEVPLALQRVNPYAAITLAYILKKRAGENVRWDDLRSIKVSEFVSVFDDDDGEQSGDDQPASEESPDPTREDGTTPEPDTATTS